MLKDIQSRSEASSWNEVQRLRNLVQDFLWSKNILLWYYCRTESNNTNNVAIFSSVAVTFRSLLLEKWKTKLTLIDIRPKNCWQDNSLTHVFYGGLGPLLPARTWHMGRCSEIHKWSLKCPFREDEAASREVCLMERRMISCLGDCELLTSSVRSRCNIQASCFWAHRYYSVPSHSSLSTTFSCGLALMASMSEKIVLQTLSSCIRSSIGRYKSSILTTNISPILFSAFSLLASAGACWYLLARTADTGCRRLLGVSSINISSPATAVGVEYKSTSIPFSKNCWGSGSLYKYVSEGLSLLK